MARGAIARSVLTSPPALPLDWRAKLYAKHVPSNRRNAQPPNSVSTSLNRRKVKSHWKGARPPIAEEERNYAISSAGYSEGLTNERAPALRAVIVRGAVSAWNRIGSVAFVYMVRGWEEPR
jgi:hypothetical protein